jgi:hypothetical protein
MFVLANNRMSGDVVLLTVYVVVCIDPLWLLCARVLVCVCVCVCVWIILGESYTILIGMRMGHILRTVSASRHCEVSH